MRMVGPWALLGAVMLRAIADAPPWVRIPAIVGSEASLNLFVGFVGPSGHGKGASDAVAREYWPSTVPELPIGTGEGLAATFFRDPSAEGADAVEGAIFTAAEVDTLSVLGGRSGATLFPELRKLVMGEMLGAQNAGRFTRRVVPAHTYRACLSVGVQPERAGVLLADVAGGTPQRLVWLPVGDPGAPEVAPTDIAPLRPPAPLWENGLSLPREVWDHTRENRRRVLRGDPTIDPFDGHRNLTRIKAAAALAIIDGRLNVDLEDWRLAEVVMTVSDRTRQAIADAVEAQRAKLTAARAETVSLQSLLTADADVRNVARRILAKLTEDGRGDRPFSHVHRWITPRLRYAIPDALAELERAKQVYVVRDGTHRRLVLRDQVRGREVIDPFLGDDS